MELSSLEFYLCKLHIGGVSNDGTVCLFVPGVPNQLRIPHPEVMFSVSSWREDSYCRPLRDTSVIYYKFCQGRPLLQLIVKPLKDWAGIPNTNLMFPLLVPYFMWLHMASNIPLAVVICLASKTWYTKWRIYVQINYFFFSLWLQYLTMLVVNRMVTILRIRRTPLLTKLSLYLQFIPLNSPYTSWSVSPSKFSAICQFTWRKLVCARLLNRCYYLFESFVIHLGINPKNI